MRRLFFLVLILLMISLAQATIHDVNIANFSFSPIKTIVQPGDTVRWHLVSGMHSSTSDDGAPKQWDSEVMTTMGMTFDVVFELADSPGPFPYHCTPHFSIMKDTIFMASTGGCCDNPGDANDDNTIGISDLTYFVDFMFGGGPAPVCKPEFDNQADCALGISDLTYFVDFMFGGGPVPVCGCVEE